MRLQENGWIMADSKNVKKNSMITVSLDSKDIKNLIYVIRGQLVMLDSDLAMLYQVETKVFNQVFHIELRMYQVQGEKI